MKIMLDNLNPDQKLATQTTDGAVLVLSGAGTGKTRVLTTRIAYILNQGLALPWQILALTFTNKAANEMKNRLEKIADGKWVISDLWCGTFHSVCLRILRFNSAAAGLRNDFLVFGDDDQKVVFKNVLNQFNYDAKDYHPATWIEKFAAVKDRGLGARPDASTKKLYEAYNQELARMNGVDFGDIILKVLELFDKNLDILTKYQKQFKYVMVDEFQDTNNSQHQLLKFLSGGHGNICCVGDDDQSIYSWRGAEIKHILNFEKNYPGAVVVRLETNYRSTSNILDAANSLISHNTGRLGKKLRTAPGVGAGEKVYSLTLPTDWDEARIIAQTIIHEKSNKKYSDFSVLIRAGSLSRLFEEEFAGRGIPYRLVGATKFYDRMEIRDSIAYIRLLVHQFDDISFLRIIARPRRGFGNVAINRLREYGENYMSALRAAPLSGRQRQGADEFLAAFDLDWAAMVPSKVAEQLLENSGYLKYWRESKEPEAKERISNIKDLIGNVISKYDNLPQFLEHASLMMTDSETSDEFGGEAVNIMTIHAAKGLEFDTVFLPGWEEGIFPNEKAINEGSIEEERRLGYVAITRAMRLAVITNTLSRMVFGSRVNNSPSRFISEIDPMYLNIQGTKTVYHKPSIPSSNPSYKKTVSDKPIFKSTSLVGKLVNHSQLGRGVIIESGDNIMTVAFGDKGIKKVAKDFLEILS